jgi:PAS domain S-box-containing protein
MCKNEKQNRTQQSQESARNTFANAFESSLTLSAEGFLMDWTAQAEKILGWRRDEVIGRRLSDILIPEKYRESYERGFKYFLGSEEVRDLNQRLNIIALHRDGRKIPIELVIALTQGPRPLGFKGSIRELTEGERSQGSKNISEEPIRQAQKFEAIGRLAGGIAHDFNNILAIIMAFTELACMDADKPDEARKFLDEIRKANDRAKDLIQRILKFVRKEKQEYKPTLLHLAVNEVLELMRSILPATIEVEMRINPATPPVLADPTQIDQVMMNLCTNAAHAIGERPGRMTIVVCPCDVKDSFTRRVNLPPGKYAQVSISNTGHGMDEETLKRIYEPFFTTKDLGEGTGLGLPVVHGIIKEHQAHIAVESQIGVGTTFHLYFPAHESVLLEKEKVTEAVSYGHGEHILFVDDEPAICSSAKLVLERLGYHVTTQTHPIEALLYFRNHPDQFQLVITDLTMPHLTGIEFARKIAEIQPRVPVLLATGYLGKWTIEKLREFGIHEVTEKPISTLALATTIRRVLNSRGKRFNSRD